MFKDIDFFPGRITYNNLLMDESLGFKEQEFAYKEDLFQVTYNEKLIIDIGWYPEFCPEGEFKVIIVANFNWEEPLYEKKCSDIINLKILVKESQRIIKKILLDVSGNNVPYLMQVENCFKLEGRGIILAGRNTGGVKLGDILIDLDDEIEVQVIGIDHLYSSDTMKMMYLNSHPPILVALSDRNLKSLVGLIFLRKSK